MSSCIAAVVSAGRSAGSCTSGTSARHADPSPVSASRGGTRSNDPSSKRTVRPGLDSVRAIGASGSTRTSSARVSLPTGLPFQNVTARSVHVSRTVTVGRPSRPGLAMEDDTVGALPSSVTRISH